MHGGSIRLYVGFGDLRLKTERLKKLISEERKLSRDWPQVLDELAKGLLKQRDDLRKFVLRQKEKGSRVAGVGASAKGITLLNYAGLGPKEIDFITEKSPLKQGLFTPSGIPVVDDKELMTQNPDYVLLLAWNFEKEITRNLSSYKKNGGKFVIPIPKLKIIA
jgi:hypothetical protein